MSLLAKVAAWSSKRGLHLVATCLALVLGATLAFLVRETVPTRATFYLALRAILSTLALLLVLSGLAAAGLWGASIHHRTWQERLRLRALQMEYDDDPNTKRREWISRFGTGGDPVHDILLQGRLYFWVGLVVGIPSLLMLGPATSSWGILERTFAFATPLMLASTGLAIAATVRGATLLVSGNALVRNVQGVVPKADTLPPSPGKIRAQKAAEARAAKAAAQKS